MREVAADFGDTVEFREYCSDDPGIRARYGTYRAIYIDGQKVSWGYKTPKEGLREAIRQTMG